MLILIGWNGTGDTVKVKAKDVRPLDNIPFKVAILVAYIALCWFVFTLLPAGREATGSMAANYSNEGGVGYTRYQKNIMGMWLLNRLRDKLCPDTPWNGILAEAEQKYFDHLVDVNDPVFLAPENMKAAFDARLPHPPGCVAGYFRCACRSLARGYRQAVEEIEKTPAGPTHHMAAAVGRHIDTILKVARIFNVPVDIITR